MIDSDINIRVQTPDSALLIGMHGKNIESFQHLLGRMIEKMTSSHIHVHLEVNDYMKEKDARLFRFLDSKIEFVMSTGKSTRIPNLTSYERKKAHGYIAEKNTLGLSTKSDGE
jgi:predicted RNA-binding protein Jag